MEPLHKNNLKEEAQFILDESRIVVPGLQALFGFQLIAVFNQAFGEKLSGFEKKLHLASLFLIFVSIVLVMTPAALHRVAEYSKITKEFTHASSRFLKFAMTLLPVGVSLEFYIICHLITESTLASAIFSAVLLLMTYSFWFVFPLIFKRYYNKVT